MFPQRVGAVCFVVGLLSILIASASAPSSSAEPLTLQDIVKTATRIEPLTEPPCSYCSTQQLKGLVRHDDLVVAWIRGNHNGGAAPVRHFLSGTRVVNDTYGLFFFDPDGAYVAAFEKDYGYSFYGWKDGVMVAKDRDGNLWSALSGRCLMGPKQGERLKRVPSLTTNWGYWLMLHPESTAYDLFDGNKYQVTPLPSDISPAARTAMQSADDRLAADRLVMGVTVGNAAIAFPLNQDADRECFLGKVGGQEVAVCWYGPTQTAVAFMRQLDGQKLTLYADDISPESAPFKDRETGSRWTIAGRAVDGPLRGKELKWADSIQCRWYAWAAEFPDTLVFDHGQ